MPLVRRIARDALPLYASALTVTAGAVVQTFVLGRSSTTALAAYTVAMAVYVPVLTAVAGSLRGVIPFVAGSATATAERRGPSRTAGGWPSSAAPWAPWSCSPSR